MKLCSIEGCNEVHHAKGFCNQHYRSFHRHGDPFKISRNKNRSCQIEGCKEPYRAKGYCKKHYFQNYWKVTN